MLGSIRLNGQTACMVIEGAANAQIFREYIRQVLGPTLQPGDLVKFPRIDGQGGRSHQRKTSEYAQNPPQLW